MSHECVRPNIRLPDPKQVRATCRRMCGPSTEISNIHAQRDKDKNNTSRPDSHSENLKHNHVTLQLASQWSPPNHTLMLPSIMCCLYRDWIFVLFLTRPINLTLTLLDTDPTTISCFKCISIKCGSTYILQIDTQHHDLFK